MTISSPGLVDQLDAALIELLAAEPRVGVLEASRRLGVARGTVQARLDRMRDRGVITGYGPDVDPAALGYEVTAFITLEIRQAGGHDPVAAQLAVIPEVLEVHTITGAGDMLCRVVARTNADLQRVLDAIVSADGVVRSSTLISLATQVSYRILPLVRAAAIGLEVRDGVQWIIWIRLAFPSLRMAVDRTIAATAAGQGGAPRPADAELDPGSADQAAQAGGLTGWGAASGLVVVGAIPQQPPGFLPRPALLKQLNQAAQAGSVVQVVTGKPGVGKSQMAAAYARARLAAGWRLVAWVDAGDAGGLLAGLAAVAEAAGLPDRGSPQDAADPGQAVRRQLEADGERCLLVFDNVESPDAVRPFLPAAGAARVLITTTRPSVADLGTAVPADVFTDQEARALLEGRTGLEVAGAAALAAELGNLPLALHQAAAVMMNGEYLAYGPYRERLHSLSVTEHLAAEQDEPYPDGVAEAVLLSLEAAQAADRTGVCARVMAIMAVLSAAGARRDLLYAAGRAGVLVDGGRWVPPAALDRALYQLVDRSLLMLSLDGQVVIPHRLTMRVVREALARQGRLRVAYRATASMLMEYADALMESRDRRAVRDISQQVSALFGHFARTEGEADKELSADLLRLRFFSLYCLTELGDSAPWAIEAGESLTADLSRVLGPGHRDTLTAQNNLAAAYQNAGRFTEAIPLFEQTLAARELALGPSHPDTLASGHSLAAAYRDAGRFTEAIPLFERTLAARERLLGADDPRTAATRDSLALAAGEAARAETAGGAESVDQVGGDFHDDGP